MGLPSREIDGRAHTRGALPTLLSPQKRRQLGDWRFVGRSLSRIQMVSAELSECNRVPPTEIQRETRKRTRRAVAQGELSSRTVESYLRLQRATPARRFSLERDRERELSRTESFFSLPFRKNILVGERGRTSREGELGTKRTARAPARRLSSLLEKSPSCACLVRRRQAGAGDG